MEQGSGEHVVRVLKGQVATSQRRIRWKFDEEGGVLGFSFENQNLRILLERRRLGSDNSCEEGTVGRSRFNEETEFLFLDSNFKMACDLCRLFRASESAVGWVISIISELVSARSSSVFTTLLCLSLAAAKRSVWPSWRVFRFRSISTTPSCPSKAAM